MGLLKEVWDEGPLGKAVLSSWAFVAVVLLPALLYGAVGEAGGWGEFWAGAACKKAECAKRRPPPVVTQLMYRQPRPQPPLGHYPLALVSRERYASEEESGGAPRKSKPRSKHKVKMADASKRKNRR